MHPEQRKTARVLPVDADGRVLLLLGRDPAQPSAQYWFTIGGGIDNGENDRDAAVRELREETGIRIEAVELLGPIHRCLHAYSYSGIDYLSDSSFFAVAVDPVSVSFDGLDEDEAANILDARWWALDDLADASLTPDLDLHSIARGAVARVAQSRAHAPIVGA